MASAPDDAVADLVAERKAMRDELRELQVASMNNVVTINRGSR